MVLRKTLTNLVLSVLTSALLALSFPKFSFFWLAWFALVPLFFIVERSTSRAAFGYAYLAGLVFFLATLQWIHFVTTLGLILLCAYLAVYFGVFGLAARYFRDRSFAERVFLLPAVWCVLEYVRDHFLTGFGWGALGHSQASFPQILFVAEWTGVCGVSFLVVMMNVIAQEWSGVFSLKQRPLRPLVLATALPVVLILLGCLTFNFRGGVRAGEKSTTVALIQPNIALDDMWTESERPRVVHELLDSSRSTLTKKPDLIIWPETSFPNFTWDDPGLFEEVLSFARENRVSLLIGTVTREEDRYYNSALLITSEGKVAQVYKKRHLVVFGEYIPFRKEFPFLASIVPIDDFSAGTDDVLFRLPNGERFAVLICFEDTISGLARRDVVSGADFLVNMTNDAWFRGSAQPRMHLENALFRSIENDRELVRATNTGVSCRVASNGYAWPCVRDAAGKSVMAEGTAVTSVFSHRRTTFYTKYGDLFTFLIFIGILGIIIKRYSGGSALWMLRRTVKRS